MTAALTPADDAILHDEFATRLDRDGPEATLSWLSNLLSRQPPVIRSRHCSLLAYTGRSEALAHLEALVGSPVTTNWGSAAALLGAPWQLLKTWLVRGGAHRLMALDALLSYRAPAPNMSPLAQIAAPVLPDRPSTGDFEAVLEAAAAGGTPRIQAAVRSIRQYSDEILSRVARGVPVERLSTLYLAPDQFAGAQEILDRHQQIRSGMNNSIARIPSRAPDE